MSASVSVFVLFTTIQVISSQDGPPVIDPSIPETCWGPPEGTNVFRCCPLPPMHREEELLKCDVPRPSRDNPEPPIDGKECTRKLCLLRNRGLLNQDDSINYEKMNAFLDAWAQNRTYITDALRIAKEICFAEKVVTQEPFVKRPDSACEPDRLYRCTTGNIIWNCKLSENTVMCKTLKEHMDECRKYLYKNPQQ